jgi:hypothetical protein
MISFKKYTEIVNAIAKKLKITKDAAIDALIKVQQKGINPLKWQKHMTMLKHFLAIVAEYDPTINEREMSSSEQLRQMNYYWVSLDHLASDKVKEKTMERNFGITNIKLGRNGKIVSFKKTRKGAFEERDYKDEYKKFQSSTKSKKYRAELNKYNRDKGTYGNGDGKDASHKDGKIVGMEDESTNRGRAEKSRLVGSKRK